MANVNLGAAKAAKNDEFYTELSDIQAELEHYKDKFAGKTVFCNCDDPFESNFVKYFLINFNRLGLKKLYASGYLISGENSGNGMMLQVSGSDKAYKVCAGDFRSDMSIELLQQADIIVTNPPFSLFREYVAQLIAYKKQFLILGSLNAITYKEFFPLLKDNCVWLGCVNGSKTYRVSDAYAEAHSDKIFLQNGQSMTKMGNTGWFTNIDHAKRHQMLPLDLGFVYQGHEKDYPKYENYDAIEVSKVSQIPCDYTGVMGVPITFLDKYCPEQFEIVGISLFEATPIRDIASADDKYEKGGNRLYIRVGPHELKRMYERLLIRRK